MMIGRYLKNYDSIFDEIQLANAHIFWRSERDEPDQNHNLILPPIYHTNSRIKTISQYHT